MSDEEPLHWTPVSRAELARTPVFAVESRRMRRGPVEAEFYVLEAPSWVNVVALTPDDELVLIEQYRHGVEQVTLEIPGGGIDPGESPRAAAERELFEETGYAAAEWRELGWVHPNPAIQGNRCTSFVALSARPVAEPRFDAHELCRVRLVPYGQVDALLVEGQVRHALVVAALLFERLRRGR